MRRIVLVIVSLAITAVPPALHAVDLNGRWYFEFPGGSTIATVTQTGSALAITLGVPLTGTVGATGPDGFTLYAVSWMAGADQASIAGRIMPSGNLFDGRTVATPFPPTVSSLVATRCTCFDGNSVNGDGCDDACQIEPCWGCTGDPSVCSPTAEGGACEDGSPCTSGETCTAGGCGGGTVLSPCADLDGPWTRHRSIPGIDLASHSATVIWQRGTDLRIDDYVGYIDPVAGTFDVRAVNLNPFCASFDWLQGAVAADGLTYAASGVIELPQPSAPDHCDVFPQTEIGDHCGDGTVAAIEQCDDGNLGGGDGCTPRCELEECWSCAGEPSVCSPSTGAPCDDESVCTTADLCDGAGTCAGSPVVCEPCLACDEVLGCVPAPQSGCKVSTRPEKSVLLIRNGGEDAKDRVLWRWNKGQATTLSELGNPAGGVALCVYDESAPAAALLFRAQLPNGDGWSSTATGFRYKDATAGSDGATAALIKSGAAGQAKAVVKGQGAALSGRPYGLPAPALATPLRVQLRGDGGLCLETRHGASSVLKNDPTRGVFKARGVP